MFRFHTDVLLKQDENLPQ